MQAINGFRDEPPCKDCELYSEATPTLPPVIEWYGTYRLDDRTAGFLEERFGRRMISLRRHSALTEKVQICWQTKPQFEHSLILCRCNTSVLRLLLELPNSRVANGMRLSELLRHFAKQESNNEDSHDDLPNRSDKSFKRFVSEIDEEQLQDILQRLEERDLTIDRFDTQCDHLITTVHQAKGFECEHVALHHELHDQKYIEEEADEDMSEENEKVDEEQNIRYVAFSRHTKSLTLLMEWHGISSEGCPQPSQEKIEHIDQNEQLEEKELTKHVLQMASQSGVGSGNTCKLPHALAKIMTRSLMFAGLDAWLFFTWRCQRMPIFCKSTAAYLLSKTDVYECTQQNPRKWCIREALPPDSSSSLREALLDVKCKKISLPWTRLVGFVEAQLKPYESRKCKKQRISLTSSSNL